MASVTSPDDGVSLDPLDVALRAPFSSSTTTETPTTTTTSLPTPQSSYPFLSDTQNTECSSHVSRYDFPTGQQGWDLSTTPSSTSTTHPSAPVPATILPPPPSIPNAPLIRDMDSFGDGSAKGSFDFSLRSASSTEHLSQSFSSLLSISLSHRRASEVSDPASGGAGSAGAGVVVGGSGLHSITETNFEGTIDGPSSPSGAAALIEFNFLPPTPTEPIPNAGHHVVHNAMQSKPPVISVAFSLEDPLRSIEIWRDDVLTSTLSADTDVGIAAANAIAEFDGYVMGGPSPGGSGVVGMGRPRPRVLKRHLSLLSVETDYERRKQAKMRGSYLSKVSNFSSAGSGSSGGKGFAALF